MLCIIYVWGKEGRDIKIYEGDCVIYFFGVLVNLVDDDRREINFFVFKGVSVNSLFFCFDIKRGELFEEEFVYSFDIFDVVVYSC